MFCGKAKNSLVFWVPLMPILAALTAWGCEAPPQAISRSQTAQVSAEPTPTGQSLPVTAILKLPQTAIELEVARTPEQQALGLMYRTELADDRGMLFPFNPPQRVNFWMRNVEIPLDMIFLRDEKIVGIAANVPPCRQATCPTYGPPESVDHVIELRGGRAAELELAVGEPLTIHFLDKSLAADDLRTEN